MAVNIKSVEEIEKMREAGRLAAQVLGMIDPFVRSGITTEALNSLCHDFIINEQKAIPAPLNYNGFPKSICTSINNVVCHGIPGEEILKDGDIINIDVTVIKDGYHGDTSKMFYVGPVNDEAEHIVTIAKECLYIGINLVQPDIHLGDIGAAIQEHAEKNHCSVVREYCGHGIGRNFHEAPQVLHYGRPGRGEILRPGMTFTIEPMINLGRHHTRLLRDNWTVVTKDGSLSAQWEHTLLVTDNGVEILTLREEEVTPAE
jgi:methionyl aminopeptidase